MGGGGSRVDPVSEAKKEAKKKVAEMRQVFRKLTEEYKANKAAMDAAAFKVLDVSGDGKLQEEEVLNALMLGTPQNKKLQAALGFGEEKVDQIMQEYGVQQQAGPPPCAQM